MSNTKFKAGDKVRRIATSYGLQKVGDESIVVSLAGTLGTLVFKNDHTTYDPKHYELVEDTTKHHPHHDLIIAWAKGAKIEYLCGTTWYRTYQPNWCTATIFRIKPEKTPLQLEFETLEQQMKTLSARMTKLKEDF